MPALWGGETKKGSPVIRTPRGIFSLVRIAAVGRAIRKKVFRSRYSAALAGMAGRMET